MDLTDKSTRVRVAAKTQLVPVRGADVRVWINPSPSELAVISEMGKRKHPQYADAEILRFWSNDPEWYGFSGTPKTGIYWVGWDSEHQPIHTAMNLNREDDPYGSGFWSPSRGHYLGGKPQ